MEKIGDTQAFKEKVKNIILEGFDPICAWGFTQIPNYVLKKENISSTEKIIYAMLLSYAWHNDRVFPGQDRLAKDLKITRRTVNGAIKGLCKSGLLEITRRGLGKTNIYILKARVKKK